MYGCDCRRCRKANSDYVRAHQIRSMPKAELRRLIAKHEELRAIYMAELKTRR